MFYFLGTEGVEPVEKETEFSDIPDEYDRLIEKLKKFVTLFDISDKDWTHEVDQVIRAYLKNPKQELLVVYYNELKLCAAFEFPEVPFHDIMYFIKELDKEINFDNFHEEILFGNLNNSIEGWNLIMVFFVLR